ncbi:MAG: hypothetical protein JNK57_09300 [Planctomycetaceae bacterium]|nr:hypothetical protein [Planctomycetaceae bacterium]
MNPRVHIVLFAEVLDGLSHNATLSVRLGLPTDGKAELRMKSRRTVS